MKSIGQWFKKQTTTSNNRAPERAKTGKWGGRSVSQLKSTFKGFAKAIGLTSLLKSVNNFIKEHFPSKVDKEKTEARTLDNTQTVSDNTNLKDIKKALKEGLDGIE